MTREGRDGANSGARRGRARLWLFWLVVGLVSAVLYAVEVPVAVSVYEVPIQVVFVLVAAHVGAIPLAVWRPREASVLAILAAFVLALSSTSGAPASPWPWAVTPMITQVLALAVVAWRDRWWWAGIAWLASGVASLLAAFIFITHIPFSGSLTNIVVFANIGVFTIAAAIVVRQLQSTRAELADERETSESERARRMMADERARIARELHDVVAHGMSILNVQATSAPYRHPGLPDEVVTEFEQIAAQTRTTLGEMRRLLGVLRSDEPLGADASAAGPGREGTRAAGRTAETAVISERADDVAAGTGTGETAVLPRAGGTAETAVIPGARDPRGTGPTAVIGAHPVLEPQPGLPQLPALIEQARQAGARIVYEPGDALGRPVDDVVGLSAYRIVQEAISNALRHAPGATITVSLARDSRMLELAIENTAPPQLTHAPPQSRRDSGPFGGTGALLRGFRGRGPSSAAAPSGGRRATGPVPAGAGGHPSGAPGSGYGLLGMRERAAAVGGTVTHGPLEGGGWRVDAVLPAHPEGTSS